jgi:excisionase family DNA binding protein
METATASPTLTQHQARKGYGAMVEQHLGRSVTIDQAAALLRVSRRTIYNRIRDGKLQTIRTIGGSQRVLVSSIDESRKPTWTGIKFDSTPEDTPQES